MANPRTYTEGVFQVSNCSAASESKSRVESSRRRKEMGENVETEEELLGKEGGRAALKSSLCYLGEGFNI